MSTAVSDQAATSPLAGPAYLLIRRLQSLTGLIFGGYIFVHLLVNATILQGGNSYQLQVDKIHSLPFLEAIEWTAIFIPFLFHAFYGVWIAVNGRPNVANYPYRKNIYYLLQRISAVIILLFVLFHVLSLKYAVFGPELSFNANGQALETIGTHMRHNWMLATMVYPLGILAATYHTANGLWTGAITWGLTITARSQRQFGLVCTGLFIATSILGMLAVVGALHVH